MKELSIEFPDGRVEKLPAKEGCLFILDTLISSLDRDGWSVIVEPGSGKLVNPLAGLTRTLGFPDPPLIVRRSVDQAVACLGYGWREQYERVTVEFREPYGVEVQTLVVSDPQNGCSPIRGCDTWGTGGDSHCVLWGTLKRWRQAVAAIPVEPPLCTGEAGATDDGKESNFRGAQQPINIYNLENVNMDVRIEKVERSNVVIGLNVDGSFNQVRNDISPAVVKALAQLQEVVRTSGAAGAKDCLDAFKDELGKQRPQKGLLQNLWTKLVGLVPTIAGMTDIVETIKGLFGDGNA